MDMAEIMILIIYIFTLPDGKTIHNNNNGYTYIGNANNQPIQFANYVDIAQYVGGNAWKSAMSELSYNHVTHSINQSFNLPTISSNLCILYMYLIATFNASVESLSISIRTHDNIDLCGVVSRYQVSGIQQSCSVLIYDTINHLGCLMFNTPNNGSVNTHTISMPLNLYFDNTYENTVPKIYGKCSLFYIA